MSTCTVVFCFTLQSLQCYSIWGPGVTTYSFPNAKAEMGRTPHSAVCYCLPGHPRLPGTPGGRGEVSCKASSGTIRGRKPPGEGGKQLGALLMDGSHHLGPCFVFPLQKGLMSVKFSWTSRSREHASPHRPRQRLGPGGSTVEEN